MTSKEDEDIKIVPNIILKPKDFRDRLNLSGIDMRTFDFVYQFMPNCEGKKYCDGCVEDTFAVIELLNDKIRTQERQKTIGMIDKFFVDLENMKLYTQSGCMYVTFFEDYNKIKKILLQDLKRKVEKG